MKHPQELEESKNSILGASETSLDQNRGSLGQAAWSSGLQEVSVTFCLLARPNLKLARSSELVERHFRGLLTVLLDLHSRAS